MVCYLMASYRFMVRVTINTLISTFPSKKVHVRVEDMTNAIKRQETMLKIDQTTREYWR